MKIRWTNARIAVTTVTRFHLQIKSVLLAEFGYNPFMIKEANFILCGIPEFRRRLKGSRHLQSILKYSPLFEVVEKNNKAKSHIGNTGKQFIIRRDVDKR